MATGSITSLGIGSGLDLQNILDQLKEADGLVIQNKKNQKTAYENKINAYNGLNAKIYAMKSNALDLSLQSNFLQNTSTLTDEEILDAVVADGLDESSYTIDVSRKASRNSWESAGVSRSNDIMFTEPDTDITEADNLVTTVAETMSIFYGESGSQQQIDINLTSGMSLNNIVDKINDSANNQDAEGTQLVSASLATNEENEYYIRLSAVSGSDTAESEITLAGFSYVAEDTTVGISQNGTAMYLSVSAGTTYEGLVNKINNAENNPGVTAAMVDNGDASNPYQLILTADNTGEDNRITLSNLSLTEVTGADGNSLNALFTVNGITYQRQANSAVSDVITGVTLNLKNIGETTLNIETQLDSVKENIVSLVNGFNELISYTNRTQENTDPENINNGDNEQDNPLANSSDINRLISNLTSLMTSIVDVESSYTSLADLGMEINKDGTITLDEDTLDQAVASDPDAVAKLFIGDADNDFTGLGDLINNSLGNMVSSQGIIATGIDALESRMERLDKDIESATERLDKRYETMTAEFVRLDTYIRQLNSQADYMQSMFDSLKQKNDN